MATQYQDAQEQDFDNLMQMFLGSPATEQVCRWVGEGGHVCNVTLPADQKLASAHFRTAHTLWGDSKEMMTCLWQNCDAHPVQRRNMIRHILSVHLGLLRWTCPDCLKIFARRGTAHNCQIGEMSSQA